MDIDPFKILAAIGTLFTIGDKLYTYAKKWRESRREAFPWFQKKSKKRTRVELKLFMLLAIQLT